MAATTLTGTTGNDTLNAPGSVSALVQGLKGSDTISLVFADDAAGGGKGNDSIAITRAGQLSNIIDGGAGDDTVFLRSAGTYGGTINLGAGADSISFATAGGTIVSNGQVFGGAGADSIRFNAITNSTIGGGADNDQIFATAANAVTASKVNGGMGADSIQFQNATTSFATVQAGKGNDTLAFTAVGNVRNSALFGGKGTDSLALNGASLNSTATVAGGGLADTITLNGAFAGGLIYGDANGQTTKGSGTGGAADGNDLIAATGAAATAVASVYGAGGADTIWFTQAFSGANLFDGGKGNDSIRISDAGTNNYGLGSILGGDGNDTIRVSLSGNTTGVLVTAMGTIDGGAGSDRIIVGTTASTIASANATAVGTMTAGFNAIIQYGAGDTIVLNTQIASNTFTAIANWSTGNPTLVSLTGAAGAAYGAGNAVTKAAMSGQGNIGIFSDGTDSMILIKNTAVANAASTYIRLLIKGADLQLTTVTGQAVSLTQTTFGITVAAQTGGGIGITLT